MNNDVKQNGSMGKYTTYFNKDNLKVLRKTNMELRINFGSNNLINRKIKNLYIKSLGYEIDSSGNPTYENFTFIAKDLDE